MSLYADALSIMLFLERDNTDLHRKLNIDVSAICDCSIDLKYLLEIFDCYNGEYPLDPLGMFTDPPSDPERSRTAPASDVSLGAPHP